MSKKPPDDQSESQNNRIKEYQMLNNLNVKSLSLPKQQPQRIIAIIRYLQESDTQGCADRHHIIALAEITGIERYKAEDIVVKLAREGEIFEKSSGRYKTID